MNRTVYKYMNRKELLSATGDEDEYGEPWGDKWDDEERLYLVEVTPGGHHAVLGADGGEPEDSSFSRDWGWVADALNRAYKQGQIETLQEGDGFLRNQLDSARANIKW